MLKYIECDFYSIEKDNSTKEKLIHIWGYIYYAGDDKDKTPYRDLEYTGFMMPLKDFLAEDFDYDSVQSGLNQYISNITKKEAEERLERYWYYHVFPNDDERPTPLSYDEITMDTPYGDYVNYNWLLYRD